MERSTIRVIENLLASYAIPLDWMETINCRYSLWFDPTKSTTNVPPTILSWVVQFGSKQATIPSPNLLRYSNKGTGASFGLERYQYTNHSFVRGGKDETFFDFFGYPYDRHLLPSRWFFWDPNQRNATRATPSWLNESNGLTHAICCFACSKLWQAQERDQRQDVWLLYKNQNLLYWLFQDCPAGTY
jgi:hypothetical protein